MPFHAEQPLPHSVAHLRRDSCSCQPVQNPPCPSDARSDDEAGVAWRTSRAGAAVDALSQPSLRRFGGRGGFAFVNISGQVSGEVVNDPIII